MKKILTILLSLLFVVPALAGDGSNLFIDVHVFEPGSVTAADVAAAHVADLRAQDAFGVRFEKYWVDEDQGLVYCLSQAADAASVVETHRRAHGLVPQHVHEVSAGAAAALRGGKQLFLDIHRLGPGNVTADAVAAAHEKDLAVQDRFGVNFANYWVDEASGLVVCLSEAGTASDVRRAHGRAHGLLPDQILAVVQGE